MKYLYYKSKKGNFGDDLNGWLWPKLFPATKENDSVTFLGIGSILYKENPSFKKLSKDTKIVFGSGVRPSPFYSEFKVDPSWDIKFLRGPLSSMALDDKYDFVTDAAYAMRHLVDFDKMKNCEKKYEISLMPYFHSVDYFDWEKICAELGYHYISPHSENGVEFTIEEIASSKKIITEAMHGAIIADILRVPWHRFVLTTPFTEGAMVSEFKWNDWLLSIGIKKHILSYIPFFSKTKAQNYYSRTELYEKINHLSSFFFSFEFLYKPKVKKDLLQKLSTVTDYYLSSDELLSKIDEKMKSKIDGFKQELLVK